MSIKDIIMQTQHILPFTIEGFPYSFTVFISESDESSFKTFSYSNKEDAERNRRKFLELYEKYRGYKLI